LKTLSKWVEAPLVIAILAITAFRSYVGDDLWFWDEATYLKRGAYPEIFGSPTWVENPGHSAMYGAWSTIFPNPIDVYFLGNATSAVAFVLGVWIAARLLGQARTAILAAVVAASLPLTYIWPHLSGIPAGSLMATGSLLLAKPGNISRAAFVTALWFSASFRPEFTWAATVVSVIVVASAAHALYTSRNSQTAKGPAVNPNRWAPLIPLAAAVILPSLIVARFGNIWQRSDREWTAFSQHYSLRNPIGAQDVWLNASDATAADFPGAGSVTEALIANPMLMLNHFLTNAIQTPISVIGHALGVESPSIAGLTLGTVAVLSLLVLTLTSLIVGRKFIRNGLRDIKLNRTNIVLIAVTMLFALAPMIAIYPRPHYQLLFVGAIIVATSSLLSLQLRSLKAVWSGSTFTLSLVLLSTLIASQFVFASNRDAKFEASIRAVQEQVADPIIVSGDQEVDAFLPGSQVAEPLSTELSITTQLNETGVNVVVITPILAQTSWAQTLGFDDFVDNPASFGFREVVPDSNIWIR